LITHRLELSIARIRRLGSKHATIPVSAGILHMSRISKKKNQYFHEDILLLLIRAIF